MRPRQVWVVEYKKPMIQSGWMFFGAYATLQEARLAIKFGRVSGEVYLVRKFIPAATAARS